MTEQLVILGNGFDLHCGLKSSYEDFLLNAMLDSTKKTFGKYRLRVDVSGFWENLLYKYYIKYNSTDYKWCDIETIIKNTLCTVFVGDGDDIAIWKFALSNVQSRRDPTEETKFILDQVEKYLLKYCMEFFYDHSNTMKDHSDQHYLDLLIEHLLKELHNFERRFCNYIKDNIVNPNNDKTINASYIVNAVNLLAKLTGFYDGSFDKIESFIKQEEKEIEVQISSVQTIIKTKKINILSNVFSKLKYTHILSFNYTALFDILAVQNPCDYNNVHGKLCNLNCKTDCNSSNIIFGIDDTFIQSHNEFTDLRLFSKTYRKMFDANAAKSILPSNRLSPIEIKFYGHSLSEADYSYFQSIFDYYELYNNDSVSLLFYYSKGYEQTDAIYRLINSYGKSLANKEQGKNLIHKLLLENRLKIVDI